MPNLAVLSITRKEDATILEHFKFITKHTTYYYKCTSILPISNENSF